MNKTLKKYFPLFVIPTLAAFLIAFLIPFLMGFYLSFTEFTTVSNARWVGLGNYKRAFTANRDFVNALWFTVRFTVLSVITINVLGFFLALLLTRDIRGTNLFRTVFFMPNLIGGIVLGYIWQLIINGVLMHFGVDITFSAKYGFWGLVILMNWQMVGYMMIIYIAGIQNIPGELNEAAAIDGATPLQTLRHVTIPMVAPSTTICTWAMASSQVFPCPIRIPARRFLECMLAQVTIRSPMPVNPQKVSNFPPMAVPSLAISVIPLVMSAAFVLSP